MIRASSTLFWFSLAILTSIGLYRTSDHVQELNRQLSTINTQIEAEQQSLHVLKAEWVYLANPSRLTALTKKHLSLQLTSPQQITTMDNVASLLPTRNEAMASVSVTATPIANVRVSMATPTPQPVGQQPMRMLKTTAAKSPTKSALPKPPVYTAVADTNHLMDHMLMQRNGSTPRGSDQIGAMLAQLDHNP